MCGIAGLLRRDGGDPAELRAQAVNLFPVHAKQLARLALANFNLFAVQLSNQ